MNEEGKLGPETGTDAEVNVNRSESQAGFHFATHIVQNANMLVIARENTSSDFRHQNGHRDCAGYSMKLFPFILRFTARFLPPK